MARFPQHCPVCPDRPRFGNSTQWYEHAKKAEHRSNLLDHLIAEADRINGEDEDENASEDDDEPPENAKNHTHWGHRELENLNLAIALSVNPKSESDWNKIAEAVCKGHTRKRNGEECKARAEKDGLLLDDQPAGTSSSTDTETHPKPRKLALRPPKKIFSSQSFEEIHTKYYDEFFSKQESPPLTATLDLDDSLVTACFNQPTTYTPTKRIRNQPFVMQLAVNYDSPAEDCEDNAPE